jgi:hypothetical protein
MNTTPTMVGHIDHRILLNYRVDPDVAAAWLPPGLRPRLVDGHAVAGICVIRMSALRPAPLPRRLGVSTDNAAHRIAVELDGPDGPAHGVFVPRRDTSSRAARALGGRLFPGTLHRAHVDADSRGGAVHVDIASDDGEVRIACAAVTADHTPSSSVFADVDAASSFFLHDPLGYSPGRRAGSYDVMELVAARWELRPLTVAHVASSVFADTGVFPTGSVAFDSAFAMQPTDARWIPHPRLEPTSARRRALAA